MPAGEKSETKNFISESENKKRLWVVTELYYPENNQTGYYLTGIAEGLAGEFDVKVICGQPNYAARGTRAPKREVHKAVEIFRVWGTTLDKDRLFLRLVNMLTLGVSMFLKTLWKINESTEVLVVSAPPSLPFVAALAAKLRGAAYSLIIQDKYPETLTAVGASKPDGFFIKILERANRILYREAKKIIVVGRDMAELVAGQFDAKNGADKTPIAVIQNWASLEEIEPRAKSENELLRKLDVLEKFVFLYAGNMGHPQDLESIVGCAELLKTDERFHFLFVGSGVKRKWLEREIVEKKLKNLTLLPALPRSEQNVFLNACDIGFVSLIKNMRGVAMPSRTYNLLAAGKPILAITETGSEVARVIEEEQVGWYVSPCEPEKLLDVIYKIFENKNALPEIGKKARRVALEKYSVEKAVEKYKIVLR